MEDLINLLQNFGVSVVMLLWFAFRLEKILKSNTEALLSLTAVIQNLKLKRKV